MVSRTHETEGHAGSDDEEERFVFTLPARLEYRDAARAFLAYVCDRLARRNAMPEDIGHRVISAFVEAFNNAVLHAYRDLMPGPVEVEMRVSRQRLRVRITDRGRSFVPDDVPEPDLDALPEGGLGLFIMRNFMDDVSYRREGASNILTMEKRLDAKADDTSSADVSLSSSARGANDG